MEINDTECISETINIDSDVLKQLNNIANESNQTTDELMSNMLKKYTEQKISEMKTIICNDFSFGMLLVEECLINIRKISKKEFDYIIEHDKYISCIGDKDIAKELNLEFNPSNISLTEKTRLIVIKPKYKGFNFYEVKHYGQWTYDWISKC